MEPIERLDHFKKIQRRKRRYEGYYRAACVEEELILGASKAAENKSAEEYSLWMARGLVQTLFLYYDYADVRTDEEATVADGTVQDAQKLLKKLVDKFGFDDIELSEPIIVFETTRK